MERPQPDAAWNRFEHSGSIADYLNYRNAVGIPGGEDTAPEKTAEPGAAAEPAGSARPQ